MRKIWRRRRGAHGDDRAGGGRARGAHRGVYGIVGFLATVIDVIVGVVCLVILAGILLFVLGANQDNSVVSAINDAAEFLVGPFGDLFERDDAKEEVAINWGIAMLVYFFIGRLITGLLRRGTA